LKNKNNQMKRLFSGLITVLFFCPYTFSQNKQPNVLIILTDDQGYYDVGACGAKDLDTPHMDQLFEAGMKFNYFYANSPVCSPTRASLLTGLYPDHAGVPGVIRTHANNSWGFLRTDVPTIADVFNEGGYHTAIIGKWHLGLESPNTPIDRGFQYFKGYLGDMMDDYWTHRRHGINYMMKNRKEIDPEGHATDLFSRWAVDYIHEQKRSDKPFMLYLAYNAPHFPVQPPDDWLQKVKKRHPELSEKRARLVAFIEHLDDGIGQVLLALKESGHYENTLIIFTSDNGGLLRDEANNGPLRDGKQSVYEGGLRVPTTFVWKGHIAAGSISDQKAATMDLLPTLAKISGLPAPEDVDGIDISPVLLGEQMMLADRSLYFVRREGGERYGGLTIQAIIHDDWKLLQNSPFAPQELYDLKNDPDESNNLIAEKQDKFRSMNTRLMKYIQQGGEVPWQLK
jgi:arylsulfatase A-like enzyme